MKKQKKHKLQTGNKVKSKQKSYSPHNLYSFCRHSLFSSFIFSLFLLCRFITLPVLENVIIKAIIFQRLVCSFSITLENKIKIKTAKKLKRFRMEFQINNNKNKNKANGRSTVVIHILGVFLF